MGYTHILQRGLTPTRVLAVTSIIITLGLIALLGARFSLSVDAAQESVVVFDKLSEAPSLTGDDQCFGSFGGSTTRHVAQKFTSTVAFDSLDVDIKIALRTTNAADAIELQLWSDSGNQPGWPLGWFTPTYSESDFQDRSIAWTTKSFTIDYMGSTATPFWVVGSRTNVSETGDGAINYCFSNTGGDVYPDHKTMYDRNNMGIWDIANDNDLVMRIAQEESPKPIWDMEPDQGTSGQIQLGRYNSEQGGASYFETATDPVTDLTVEIKLYKSGNPANVTVEVRENNAGVPGNVVSGWSTIVPSSHFSSGNSIATLALTGDVNLTPSTKYWITFIIDTVSNGNHYSLYGRFGSNPSVPPPYEYDMLKWNGSSWSSYINNQFAWKITAKEGGFTDPTVTLPEQYESDETPVSPQASLTKQNKIILAGTVHSGDPSSTNRFEIELRRTEELEDNDGNFFDTPTEISDDTWYNDGGRPYIHVYGLIVGEYHWQYRVRSGAGQIGDWIEFDGPGADFSVDANTPNVIWDVDPDPERNVGALIQLGRYNSEQGGAAYFETATDPVTDLTVEISIRKFGNPANVTVEVHEDSAGTPGDVVSGWSTILPSSHFPSGSGSVSTIVLSDEVGNMTLDPSTKYWITFVIDTVSNGNHYWISGHYGNSPAMQPPYEYNIHKWNGSSWSSYINDQFSWRLTANEGGFTDPTVTLPEQYESNLTPVFPQASLTKQNKIILAGTVHPGDPSSTNRFEIELRRAEELEDNNGNFFDIPTEISDDTWYSDGGRPYIHIYGLILGEYHWQYRVRSGAGQIGDWIEFNGPGADFSVDENTPKVIWDVDPDPERNVGALIQLGRYSSEQGGAAYFETGVDSVTDLTVEISIRKFGNPANVTVEVHEDSAGTPGAVVYGWSTIVPSSHVSSGNSVSTIVLSDEVGSTTLDPSTKYWITFVIDTVSNGNHYYLYSRFGSNPSVPPPYEYDMLKWNGSSWSSYINDQFAWKLTNGIIPEPAPPTITDPSEPTTYYSLPVHVEGTCEDDEVSVEWFYDTWGGMPWSFVTYPCESGIWSDDTPYLEEGDYTLKACNAGTAVCATESVTINLSSAPPPTSASEGQFKADGFTEIEEYQTTDESTVVFKADIQNASGDPVRWQIELRELGEGFLDTYDIMDGGFLQTDPVTATMPTSVEIIRPYLENGEYHWQYRAYVDATETPSAWTPYKTDDSNADFGVETTQEIKVAVILAETKDADMASNTKDRILNDDLAATNDIDSLLRNYFCENSFGDYDEPSDTCVGGLINISLEIIDDNGQPFELDEDVDHYGENTFLDIKYTISVGTDGNGKDIEIKSNDHTAELIWEAINKADALNPSPDFDSFDIVVVVYEGGSESRLDSGRPQTFAWPVHFSPSASPNELAVNWIPMAETWDVGVWAHEIAHIMGEITADKYLCDLYPYPRSPKLGCSENMNAWDLMGGKGPHLADGAHPSNLSSYSLVELTWLENSTDVLPGSFTVTGLADMKYLDEVETVSIDDDTYYIVEARKKTAESVRWDSELPEDEALVIYRVRNDTRREVVYPEQEKQEVDRNMVRFEEALTFDGDAFIDEKNNIAIIADTFNSGAVFTVAARYESDTDTVNRQLAFIEPNNQQIQDIEGDSAPLGVPPLDPAELEPSSGELIVHAFLSSAMLQEDGQYGWLLYVALLFAGVLVYLVRSGKIEKWPSKKRISIKRAILVAIILPMLGYSYFIVDHVGHYPLSSDDSFFRMEHESWLSPEGSVPIEIADPDEDVLLPDLDLHAYDDQGNHVGMNYIAGEYENQIPGAHTTGDRLYDEEWISVPEGTNVHFEVSTHDIEEFFEENPDIAASLPSLEESYTFGAVTYDATSTRYEAVPVEDVTINPGETRIHTIGGTTEAPTVDEGVVVVELDVIADSYLKKGHPNKNLGDELTMFIRGSGNRSPLVQFDQQAIEDAVGTGTLVSATLELDVVDGSSGSWTSNGKLVYSHRLTHPWTELGATWNCGNDIDTSDSSPDCDGETWEMNQNQSFSWEAVASDSILFTNDSSGTVSWDVTTDVAAFLAGTNNHGWIIRKEVDGAQGKIEFHSRESGVAPRLVLTLSGL